MVANSEGSESAVNDYFELLHGSIYERRIEIIEHPLKNWEKCIGKENTLSNNILLYRQSVMLATAHILYS